MLTCVAKKFIFIGEQSLKNTASSENVRKRNHTNEKKIIVIFNYIKSSFQQNFADTKQGVRLFTTGMAAILCGEAAAEYFRPGGLFFLVGALLGGVLWNAAAAISGFLLKKWYKKDGKSLFYTAVGCAVFLYICVSGSISSDKRLCAVFAAAAYLLMLLAAKSLWAAVVNRVRTKLLGVCLAVSGTAAVCMAALIFGSGYSDSYIQEYQKLKQESSGRKELPEDVLEAGFAAYTADGNYTPESLLYGAKDSGTADIFTDTVDLSRYVPKEKSGFGYTAGCFRNTPLRTRRLPEKSGFRGKQKTALLFLWRMGITRLQNRRISAMTISGNI